MIVQENFLAKRKERKFYMKRKEYQGLKKMIQRIFEDQNVPNCNLYIRMKGGSFSISDYLSKSGVGVVQIAFSEDMKTFKALKKDCGFEGDFSRLMKFFTLHEIGHQKDECLALLKGERGVPRRKMYQETDMKEWKVLSAKVIELTLQIERNAWDYVSDKVLPEEMEDLQRCRDYCLKLYQESWEIYSARYFSTPELRKKLEG